MEVLYSCRCCLRRPPDRALTTPYTHLGHTEIYAHMLEECFDVHVNTLTLGVDGECGICEKCVGRLRVASDFKLQVQRSQATLQAQFEKITQVKVEELALDTEMDDENGTSEQPVQCEEPPVKREIEENDGNSSEEGREILHEERANKPEKLGDAPSEEQCVLPSVKAEPASSASPLPARARRQLAMVCSVRLERLPSPATREGPSHAAGLRARKLYTCDTCGQQFKDQSSMVRHVKKQHNDTKKLCLDEEVICDICHKTLKTRNIKAHMRTHTGEKPYACDICDKRFIHICRLNTHKVKHTGAKPYSCKICKKGFSRSTAVRRHERRHTMLKPYSCEECHKTFKELEYLQVHKRIIHSSETPYTCDQCGARFKRKHALALHLEMHAGKRRFSCGVCEKQFSYRNDLRTHEFIHTGEKPYACEICDKRFRKLYALNQHKLQHTGAKPYSCKICKKKFSRYHAVRKHEISHANLKTYSCEECHKTFMELKYLRQHKKFVHSSERPYICDKCGTRFKRKASLAFHLDNIHTKKRRFTCGVCDKQFSYRYDLFRHEFNHAGEKPPAIYATKVYSKITHKEQAQGGTYRKP